MRGIQEDRPCELYIHGIGESGLSFREILNHLSLDSIDVVVPDSVYPLAKTPDQLIIESQTYRRPFC